MQKIIFLSLLALVLLSSCAEDQCETTFTYQSYEPIYRTADEIKATVSFESDRKLEAPGKIYYYNNYILINERQQGVHVIDNRDKTAPKKLGFIKIDGNLDIALSGNYIYADTWYNILVIDISDIEKPDIVNVINSVKESPFEIEPGRFIVDYQVSDVEQKIDCSDENTGALWFVENGQVFVRDLIDVQGGGVPIFSSNQDSRGADASSGAQEGQAGSMSRMALFGGYFYYVNEYQMHVFDVSDLSEPDKVSEVFMEWGVETLFPYKRNLFVGANNGMHIYDNSNPTNPQYLSTFNHANACDPVVVQDDIAYITLRDGNECENFNNQLDVVDVSNLLKPELIASFPMHNPHGLAVRDEVLYLCEGDQGLKVFDITEVEEIGQHQIGGVKEYQAFDVISLNSDLLLMIGEDGFYQFDTERPMNPNLLSSIKIGE